MSSDGKGPGTVFRDFSPQGVSWTPPTVVRPSGSDDRAEPGVSSVSVKIADTAEKSEDPVRVVFIGGLGRSGTTLLERLLGQLPGVVPLGEITHLWERDLVGDEMCACGATFSYCEFWQRIGKAAFGSWDEVDVERLAALKATVDRTRH